MSNEFSYKGYSGSREISIEDGCLYGRILFIDDLITYEGNTVPELDASFKTAVNGYVDYCAQTGKPANKPYSGTFNVRVGSDLHRAAAQCARRSNVALNELVRRALEKEVGQSTASEVVHHEITVNHIVTHKQETIEMPYSSEEQSWQQNPEKPRLRLVS